MSFYSSSSFLSSTNSTYSTNSVNSLNHKSSYYNDIYRSYSNIPKYAPVSYSVLKRPSYFELKKDMNKTPVGNDAILNSKPFYNSESNLNSDDGRRSQGSFDDSMTKSVISIDGSTKDDSILTKSVQNDSKEFVASAVSNVQLSVTDDLTTQVDYYLNEFKIKKKVKNSFNSKAKFCIRIFKSQVFTSPQLKIDNRMICSGRQVEVESFELSTKSGLISKCMYLNSLLTQAKMNESILDSDPVFTKNGKGILVFIDKKDAEDFTRFHSRKFSVTYNNSVDQERLRNQQKKNVTFGENDSKPLYKSSTNQLSSTSTSSINDLSNNQINHNDILISTNNSSKKNKTDGYEILTIRAKLKQRIGQNRTKNVTLTDIDSIMRNVVSIIQDEFMKRFPSGPSAAITDGRN
ncbi:unnamed protein product [Brachionus calyciflorus]|uniref:Uncharacterized protein n=1 Tax=Brachionus calyciflorus TaxID=104777 RepID=A0A813M4J4_9BILA|nr:unnamed protein product [Brachionus calyciflorus]